MCSLLSNIDIFFQILMKMEPAAGRQQRFPRSPFVLELQPFWNAPMPAPVTKRRTTKAMTTVPARMTITRTSCGGHAMVNCWHRPLGAIGRAAVESGSSKMLRLRIRDCTRAGQRGMMALSVNDHGGWLCWVSKIHGSS